MVLQWFLHYNFRVHMAVAVKCGDPAPYLKPQLVVLVQVQGVLMPPETTSPGPERVPETVYLEKIKKIFIFSKIFEIFLAGGRCPPDPPIFGWGGKAPPDPP